MAAQAGLSLHMSNATLLEMPCDGSIFYIYLQVEVNADTQEPLDNLTPEAITWCKSIDSNSSTVSEALLDKKILVAIQAGIDKANEKAVSRAAKIQKWSVLPKDFSMPGGELGELNNCHRFR